MRKILFVLALAVLLTAPVALADTRQCNGTMVTAGLCRSTDNWLLSWDAVLGALQDLRDAALWAGNYQAQVLCAQSRVVDRGMLQSAGVDQGDCTVEQLGTQVANPQTTTSFADAYVRSTLVDLVRRHKAFLEDQTAATAKEGIADPDIGGSP